MTTEPDMSEILEPDEAWFAKAELRLPIKCRDCDNYAVTIVWMPKGSITHTDPVQGLCYQHYIKCKNADNEVYLIIKARLEK